MNFKNRLNTGFCRCADKSQKIPEPEALDGSEERTESLSSINITYFICHFRDLLTAKYTHLIAHELSVPEEKVEEDLKNYMNGVDPDVVCCLEYPYIEEYYRDTYYSFYSRKHHDYNRHCFRISFFTKDVTEVNFFSIDLNGRFLGYIVLRPTPRRIIGYSFLSPNLLPHKNIAICICRRLISVMGRSLEVIGFPFSSHDGESISCSENSILLVFDYFSRRYNNYARVLPSYISNIKSNYSGRCQPSLGLSIADATTVFNNLGMTTRTYLRKDENPSKDDFEFSTEEFYSLLRVFVESGLPIYVSETDHAYLVIGRENKLFELGAKFVVMDGCRQSYHILDDINSIESFIVPMPDNILLDAQLVDAQGFLSKLNKDYPEVTLFDETKEYKHRIYLTTSRSFKKHIVESGLSHEDKMLIACTAMPKFIWISESIVTEELAKDTTDVKVEVFGVYDATDYPAESNHLLLAKTKECLIVPTTDNSKLRRRRYSVFNCNYQLSTFQFNLKGVHTGWQG